MSISSDLVHCFNRKYSIYIYMKNEFSTYKPATKCCHFFLTFCLSDYIKKCPPNTWLRLWGRLIYTGHDSINVWTILGQGSSAISFYLRKLTTMYDILQHPKINMKSTVTHFFGFGLQFCLLWIFRFRSAFGCPK